MCFVAVPFLCIQSHFFSKIFTSSPDLSSKLHIFEYLIDISLFMFPSSLKLRKSIINFYSLITKILSSNSFFFSHYSSTTPILLSQFPENIMFHPSQRFPHVVSLIKFLPPVILSIERLTGPYYVPSYHFIFLFITLVTVYNQALFSIYHSFYYYFNVIG